jgi:hypothetical protein
MKHGPSQVGFSQRVQLAWLDFTAGLVLTGKENATINDALQEYLKDKLSVGGSAVRGTREKVITILMKIWAIPPNHLQGVRDDGLALLRRSPSSDHLAIHWGMTMAVYPFWNTVAETVGRLLRLQKDVGAAQVQRRIREQLGERETVARAARRAIRSFIDWGVLVEGSKKGVYRAAAPVTVGDCGLQRWLVEAFLAAHAPQWQSLATIDKNPSLFPIAMDRITAALLDSSPRVEVVRHGLDQEMARWRQNGAGEMKKQGSG